MSNTYLIEREIGIDAGHRVTLHGSKCKNLHGHRYTVIAACTGPLVEKGEQQGMVLDFGFLKDEMMKAIDECCDHAMILGVDDPLARHFIGDNARFASEVRPQVVATGYFHTTQSLTGALYIMDAVPTAENLAEHWYSKLKPRVEARSDGQAHLYQIKVYETPNCMAAYPAFPERALQETAVRGNPAALKL
jgi:6-pyruvoyltetrahydropterin/6-carboxytetrahydropterin synthase